MIAAMTEREGRAVLRARFQAAGLEIAEDVRVGLGGHVIDADGFDAARGIGYEYMTREAGDFDEIGPEVVAAIDDHARRGDVLLLLIDEDDVGSKEDLALAADRFLAELRARGRLT
jgi:hypothetical protein